MSLVFRVVLLLPLGRPQQWHKCGECKKQEPMLLIIGYRLCSLHCIIYVWGQELVIVLCCVQTLNTLPPLNYCKLYKVYATCKSQCTLFCTKYSRTFQGLSGSHFPFFQGLYAVQNPAVLIVSICFLDYFVLSITFMPVTLHYFRNRHLKMGVGWN